ncbi:MAG: glycosyltransferase, partial [Candidatus Neoclostridium sp.]
IEAEGIGCLEAIACGLVPIICNSERCATKSYALCPESTFENGNPDDLAGKIDGWIEHPEKRAEYSEKYVAFASEDLRQESCMKKMEKMLYETAERFKKK